MKTKLAIDKIVPFLKERFAFSIDTKGTEVVRSTSDLVSDKDNDNIAIVRASTDSVDAEGDMLVQSGVNLDEFVKRGIIPVNHDYSVEKIVGKPKAIKVDEHATYISFEFATSSFAKEIRDMVKGGFLKACSIGFVTDEAIKFGQRGWDEAVKKYASHLKQEALANLKRIVTKWTVLELSLVGLGCNGDALVQQMALGGLVVSKKTLDILGVEVIDKPVEAVEEVKEVKEEVVEVKESKESKELEVPATPAGPASPVPITPQELPEDHPANCECDVCKCNGIEPYQTLKMCKACYSKMLSKLLEPEEPKGDPVQTPINEPPMNKEVPEVIEHKVLAKNEDEYKKELELIKKGMIWEVIK